MGLQTKGCQHPLMWACSAACCRTWRVHQVGCQLSSDSSRVLTEVQVAFSLLFFIYIHPRLCQPVELPPVLQDITPGGQSSSWEIPAALGKKTCWFGIFSKCSFWGSGWSRFSGWGFFSLDGCCHWIQDVLQGKAVLTDPTGFPGAQKGCLTCACAISCPVT